MVMLVMFHQLPLHFTPQPDEIPEQSSVPPVKLILELDVPLFRSCSVLVNLMVPLTVMISPAFAADMADFSADSVVTVTLVLRLGAFEGRTSFWSQPAKATAARMIAIHFL